MNCWCHHSRHTTLLLCKGWVRKPWLNMMFCNKTNSCRQTHGSKQSAKIYQLSYKNVGYATLCCHLFDKVLASTPTLSVSSFIISLRPTNLFLNAKTRSFPICSALGHFQSNCAYLADKTVMHPVSARLVVVPE